MKEIDRAYEYSHICSYSFSNVKACSQLNIGHTHIFFIRHRPPMWQKITKPEHRSHSNLTNCSKKVEISLIAVESLIFQQIMKSMFIHC